MKKMLFILMALAIATPAMALTVKATDEGSGVVRLDYVKDTAGEQRVRGFGLDITVATGATVAVKSGSFLTGVSTASNKCYGIFPGTITINPDGTITPGNYGTPAAKVGSPGAGTGNVLTLEMGSLYSPTTTDTNAPVPNAGGTLTLCRLQVTQGTAASPVALGITLNSTRGGIVLEDATAAVSPTLTGTNVSFAAPDCFPSTRPLEYAQWVAVGKPASWCNARQCYGDADGQQEAVGRGTTWVGQNDLNILISGWKNTTYTNPTACPWVAADFSRSAEAVGRGSARVGQADLNILIANWKATSGIPTDCLNANPAK